MTMYSRGQCLSLQASPFSISLPLALPAETSLTGINIHVGQDNLQNGPTCHPATVRTVVASPIPPYLFQQAATACLDVVVRVWLLEVPTFPGRF
jgi:hypothetical protein